MVKKGNYVFFIFIIIVIFAVWFNNYKPENSFGVSTTKTPTVSVVPSTVTPTLMNSTSSAILENDNGKTFVYPLFSQFTVMLDKKNHPQDFLVCVPTTIIQSLTTLATTTLTYTTSFITKQTGECTLSDKDFHVTIVVKNSR